MNMSDASPELLDHVAERFAALSDPTRLRLLLALKGRDRGVSELAEAAGVSQPAASKHLAVLRRAGLVDVDRVGTRAVHRVDDASVYDLCSTVCAGVVRHLTDRHAKLLGDGEGEGEEEAG